MTRAHRLLWLYIVLVLYLCLYPWNFQSVPVQPMWSWTLPPGRTLFVDAILNLFLFLPVGFTGVLATGRTWRAVPLLVCAAILSATIEGLQSFLPSRDSSAWDVIHNTMGTGIGIGLGIPLKQRMLTAAVLGTQFRLNFRATLLLGCFLAAQLFPFIPRLRLPHLRASLQALVEPPDLLTFVSAFVSFLVVAHLMLSVAKNFWPPGAVASVLLLFLALRPLFSGGVQPGAAILAAACGAFAGEFLPQRFLKEWLGIALLGYLVLRQLYPFHFVALAKPVYWLPFDSILQLSTESGVRILFEKSFVYGALIWALANTHKKLILAIAVSAFLLVAGELAQQWIKGRTPDMLDPVLAILMGVLLMVLPRGYPGASRISSDTAPG